MPQPDDATQSLIRRLTAATVAGKLDWKSTSSHNFKLAAGPATVEIQSGDEDGDHPYLVTVKNADGIPIGGGDTIPGEGYAPWESEIAELYAAARNRALGVRDTYDRLAEELGLPRDPGEIPF